MSDIVPTTTADDLGPVLPTVGPVASATAHIDPAQARVDAVAATLAEAYKRASTLELTKEEANALMEPFPDEAFQPGADGKENLIYIQHANLRQRLNQVIGVGRWSIITRRTWGENFTTGKGVPATRIYVEAVLLIRGCFTAEAIGDMVYYPNNASQNYGDAVEGAKSAALRRCAKELGVGLQAWQKDFCEGWMQRKLGGEEQLREARRQEDRKVPIPAKEAAPVAMKPEAPSAAAKPAFAKFDEYIAFLNIAKNRFLAVCQPMMEQATNWAINNSLIMPNEQLVAIDVSALFPSCNGTMSKDAIVEALETDYNSNMAGIKQLVDAAVESDPETKEWREIETSEWPDNEDKQPGPLKVTPQQKEAGSMRRGIMVKAVTVKRGGTPSKPWTLYGIVDAEGTWYNTFDNKVGKEAMALKGQRAVVSFAVENYKGKDGNKLQGIKPD